MKKSFLVNLFNLTPECAGKNVFFNLTFLFVLKTRLKKLQQGSHTGIYFLFQWMVSSEKAFKKVPPIFMNVKLRKLTNQN